MATFPLLGLIASPVIPLTDSRLLGSYRQRGQPSAVSVCGASCLGSTSLSVLSFNSVLSLCQPLVAPPRLSVLLAVADLIQLYSLVHRLLSGSFLFGGLIPCPCFFFLFRSISLDFCSGFSSSSIVQYMYQTLLNPERPRLTRHKISKNLFENFAMHGTSDISSVGRGAPAMHNVCSQSSQLRPSDNH